MAKPHNTSICILREIDTESDWELSEDELWEMEEDGESELLSPCTPCNPLDKYPGNS